MYFSGKYLDIENVVNQLGSVSDVAHCRAGKALGVIAPNKHLPSMPVLPIRSRHFRLTHLSLEENVANFTKRIAIGFAVLTLMPASSWTQSVSYLELRNAGRAEYLAGHLASAETLFRHA